MRRLRSLIFLCLALPGWADTVLVLSLFNESSTANLDWIGESVAHTVSEALLSRGLLVSIGRIARRSTGGSRSGRTPTSRTLP